MGNVCRYRNWIQYPNQSDYHGLISKCEDLKKEKTVKTFVECHNTCARSSGRTCKFWGCSHRKLYSEIESEHDYEFFMANSKCSFYKPKL